MRLLTIANKNLKKNASFYSFYFISVAFVLMVFFAFISFSMNDMIMEKISSDGRVETMSKTIAIFIMAFVLFYMSYFNTFFMKRRMKELGVYSLLGYRKSSMLKLLTFENIFICFGSLLVGIVAGVFAHKVIVEVIVRVLNLQINTSKIPIINMNAVWITFLFVFIVLAVLLLSNWQVLRKSSLLSLIHLEKSEEKQISVKWHLAIIGLLLILISYALALDITRGKESLWTTIGFSPIALLTMVSAVIGTIFFIHSFLPFAIRKLKKKQNWFYTEMNIIILPDFIYKIRSKARTLILLTLLVSGTLAIFGSTVLSVYYPVAATERIIPSAIEFLVEDEQLADKAINIARDTVGKENMKNSETTIIRVTSSSIHLPSEYNLKDIPGFDLISESDYKKLMEIQGNEDEFKNLTSNESILVKYRHEKENSDKGNIYNLVLSANNSVDVTVKDTTLLNPIGFANSVGTLIISDQLYNDIKNFDLPKKTIMSIDGSDMRNNREVYEILAPLFEDNIYFASSYQRNELITYENSSTFLLITFVTIIFFVATGSILYFHNIASTMSSKDDFTILERMGYNKKQIKKIISKEVFTLFSIPYVLGISHSIFALIAYKSALMDDLLGKSSAFLLPTIFTMIIFTFVYSCYYWVTTRACHKIIFNN